jgi:hypothetical protein
VEHYNIDIWHYCHHLGLGDIIPAWNGHPHTIWVFMNNGLGEVIIRMVVDNIPTRLPTGNWERYHGIPTELS